MAKRNRTMASGSIVSIVGSWRKLWAAKVKRGIVALERCRERRDGCVGSGGGSVPEQKEQCFRRFQTSIFLNTENRSRRGMRTTLVGDEQCQREPSVRPTNRKGPADREMTATDLRPIFTASCSLRARFSDREFRGENQRPMYRTAELPSWQILPVP